ncbi:MAG: diguanylate cyclase [Thermomonas sp.]|uniref:GGDEF domain-containing protein n=1 Tax=Thermomonas sp. TaxID=1971895 RepID=UPI001EC0409D|nr:GGDEF domain-containing protein [Thermomonas sp.]MBV2208500.1 diguanylate cyclase [Thermomonas sp.]
MSKKSAPTGTPPQPPADNVLRLHEPASAEEDAACWKAVLEATQQGVWEYDGRTDTVYHSPLWKSLLGYADEEVGNSLNEWMSRIHPDDRPRVQQEMQRHFKEEVPFYESLHRIRHKDGSYRWVQDRGRVTERDSNGQPLRIIGTKMDASSRQREQENLDRLTEQVPGVLYQFQLSPSGHSWFPYASPNAERMFGLPSEKLRTDATHAFALVHPDDLAPTMASIAYSAQTLEQWAADFRIQVPDQGERWLHGYSQPQRLENGDTLWHGYLQDITEEKQQTLKLQETEHLLRRLMNEMPMGLALVDDGGQFYFRNRRFHELFGFPEDEALSLQHWWEESYPDPNYQTEVIQDWNTALAFSRAHGGEIPRKDYRVTLRNGSVRTMAIGGLTFGTHFMATFEDRTEQLAQSELLRKMAYLDGLTGISNRRHFDETLATEWRRGQRNGLPISLLMLDIDHFKAYNDLYGHQRGDECLQSVARALQDGLARAQDMAARYGGEEFVCLLPECDLDGATHVAQHLLQTVQALGIEHKGSPVAGVVTVSIGVASVTPSEHSSAETLLARADELLYRAKQTGRNRVETGIGS